MNTENHDVQNDLRNMYDECRKHMNYHVTLTMTDGSTFDGIIVEVDRDNFTVLAGEDVMERENENGSDSRQYYGDFGRPRRRFRRFRRRAFPFASLAALALLPYITPTPYPYYPSPYPYPYY
ncbi:small nuclear ribonucleoprotein [Virgibacillus sp. C22-A2]|uniref:Small nuclear ribonucleoprotein n=1 Tax=Virgibacillus tibetensis TaxID=3042313 RepID=A0ABU6KHP2_9BACI|nr:small nuclear ribonucleoprotein [Virgibacillus sp. C22-A2]